MKRVKRIDDFYTLEDQKRARLDDQLCDQCGVADCTVRLVLKRLKVNRYNAALNVVRCKSFMPALDFRDPAGMEIEFNTFRLGKAWVDRLVDGQAVSLRGPGGKIFGSAEVRAVHSGTFEEMNKRFGADNHLAIDAELNDREFDLHRVMEQNYGPQRFNSGSMVTVIELRRIGGSSSQG